MQTANFTLKTLPAELPRSNRRRQEELQKQLAEAKQQATKGQADAMHFCRLALEAGDSETDVNDLNLIRYLLCYLQYGEKHYYDAIVIGDFLAKRYPDSQVPGRVRRSSLASYVNLYAESRMTTRSSRRSRSSRWPTTS